MKKTIKIMVAGGLVTAMTAFAAPALAAAPSLFVSLAGSGDIANISVSNADPNSALTLCRRQSTQLWTAITGNWWTDNYGNLSIPSLSLGADGTSNPVEQYVVTNNSQCNQQGQVSNIVQTYPYGNGCTYNCGNPYTLSLSQTSINLSSGQSATVTAYGNYGSLYISGSPNSYVASAYVSGNSIVISAQNTGETTVNVCANNGGQCAGVRVTVSGSLYGSVYFSQQNPNLSSGQYQQVSIYSNNYGGNYYLSSNTNPESVSANVAGSQLNLTGNRPGGSTVTVCQSGGNSCGSVYVTVSAESGGLYLSQSSININAGQSSAVTAYGTGGVYISGNSNPSAVTAAVSGSQINLYGVNSGSSTITVCLNGSYYAGNQCATLVVYVSGYGSGSLVFAPGSLPQPVAGQYYSYQLQASGGNAPYTYDIVNGSLPSGLALSSSGFISGTAAAGSGGTASIRVTDLYGRNATSAVILSTSGSVLGGAAFANGTLLLTDRTVYIVYNNTRTGFANAWVFQTLGYKFSQVVSQNGVYIPDSGYTVTNPYAPHPWGSWVKSGKTIYYVHQSGLIPVPDWNTFVSNGGNSAMVVSANQYDFGLPMLAVMNYSDYRLR